MTDVRNFGFFVDVPGLAHERRWCRSRPWTDDFYIFDSARNQLIGRRTRRVIKLGDKVEVQVAKVDRFKKQVDFRLAGPPVASQTRPGPSRPGQTGTGPHRPGQARQGHGKSGQGRPGQLRTARAGRGQFQTGFQARKSSGGGGRRRHPDSGRRTLIVGMVKAGTGPKPGRPAGAGRQGKDLRSRAVSAGEGAMHSAICSGPVGGFPGKEQGVRERQ